MDRGSCRATVHGVTQSCTWLSDLAHTHWSTAIYNIVPTSTIQQSESVTHIHVSPLFWLSFPCRSPVPLNLPGFFLYFPAHTTLNKLCNFVIQLFTLCIHPLEYRLRGSGRALTPLFLLTGTSLVSRTETEPARCSVNMMLERWGCR